ncbi:MAG: DUF192 domain-containing protein, partial [Patescibacteria group bacterium]|nr:DUF192 domain-containing protein [Patescibacteria group bacterium]
LIMDKKKKARLKLVLVVVVILSGIIACLLALNYLGREEPTEQVYLKISTNGKELSVQAELAVTQKDHKTGLMYRDKLCEDCGMFFVFDSNVTSGFWMKNCLIPLDIIFIDEDGCVVDIKEDFEPCEQDPCQIYVPQKQYRYVLEVNSGWCSKNNVDLEAVLDLVH